MNFVIEALVAGVLFAAGVYLITDAHSFRRILGVIAIGHAINVTFFVTGKVSGRPAFVFDGTTPEALANPLPQALVLTAIVISLTVITLLAAIAFRKVDADGTEADDPAPLRNHEGD
ncbi:MAG: NADH-quinone oxidoreductase subunit K [Myxococcales bacterium]|nr:NADH-quinone oxidoreductase subunit K [Myxococcales bacterium]